MLVAKNFRMLPDFSRSLSLCADYLILVFKIDVRIFIPTHGGHHPLVENPEVLQLFLQIDGAAQEKRLVSHPRHKFDFTLGGNIYLLYLVVPERVGGDVFSQSDEMPLGESFVYVACGNDQIGFVTLGKHRETFLIDIVVFSIVRDDAQHRHSLLLFHKER